MKKIILTIITLLNVLNTIHSKENLIQPNIIHILTDDLGWQDIGCYYKDIHNKESIYETPNMDKLAKNGKRFMQAYSPAPTCSPSRAAYMAGQYTPHTGILHVRGGTLPRAYHKSHNYIDPFYTCRLNLKTPIIPVILKEAGYSTAHIQKWHFGGRAKGFPGPLDYGFDFSWEWENLHYNDPEIYDINNKKTADREGLWRPMKPNRITGFASSYNPKDPYALDPNDDDRPFDAVVDIAIKWMDKIKEKNKPFFLNFSPSFVHAPFSTRDKKRLKYYCKKMNIPFPTDPGRITNMDPGFSNPYYASMIDSLDWQVGKIVEYLEKTNDPRNPGYKLIENTYIMVSSDNGGLEDSPIKNGKDKGECERITDNTPLSGGKLKILEGGIRIPFIIQGPGITPNSVCQTPINLIDLFPTYIAMANAKTNRTLNLDGCNILPLILNKEKNAKFKNGKIRESMFWHYPSVMPCSSIIRKNGWKLRWNHAPELNRLPKIMLYKLYNIDGSINDIGEKNNLANIEIEKRDELLNELKNWIKKYNAPIPYKNANSSNRRKLKNKNKVPKVLKLESVDNILKLHLNTKPEMKINEDFELSIIPGTEKSKIVEAKLLYTTNGSRLLQHKKNHEEWFETKAKIKEDLITAIAPPGMTHGIFYLRDENNFLITSEPLPPQTGKEIIRSTGKDMLINGYAYKPGLISLIKLALFIEKKAENSGQNTENIRNSIENSIKTIKTPVQENSYALAIRNLRKEIKSLNVEQTKLPILHQFKTEKW